MNDNTMRFGKYEGRPIEVALKDKSYVKWLRDQDWLEERYPDVHEALMSQQSSKGKAKGKKKQPTQQEASSASGTAAPQSKKPEITMPFGKYEGKPIEVALDDESYLNWLLGQEWLEEKYPDIHRAVSARQASSQNQPARKNKQKQNQSGKRGPKAARKARVLVEQCPECGGLMTWQVPAGENDEDYYPGACDDCLEAAFADD